MVSEKYLRFHQVLSILYLRAGCTSCIKGVLSHATRPYINISQAVFPGK